MGRLIYTLPDGSDYTVIQDEGIDVRIPFDSGVSGNTGAGRPRNLKRYLVEDTFNGEPGRLDGDTVDEEFVHNFTAIETRRFFINLGGHEQMRKNKDGTITCKSVSPDGKEVREVRFTPVSRNGDS